MTAHLQVDGRWRGVSQQQHHEEEWVWSGEDVPLVCHDYYGGSCRSRQSVSHHHLRPRVLHRAHT